MSEDAKVEVEEAAEPIRVNGEDVGQGLIEQELQMLRERYSHEMSYQEMDDQREKIESDARENAVERLLLIQRARQEVRDIPPEEVEARLTALKHQHGGEEEFAERFDLTDEDLAAVRRDILDGVKLERLFDQICEQVARPGEADSRAYYDAHLEEFNEPEMVNASHILMHQLPGEPVEKIYAELLNVRERAKNGEDFNTLADEFSRCGDGGSELGFFPRGQMVPSFEQVAFATPVGEVSDVFQTEFGYHILKVLERKDPTVRAYEDVRYDIESKLFDERKNEAIGVVADELRAVADIQNLVVVEA